MDKLSPDLQGALNSWSFNVMLECSGHNDDKIECALGGETLNLRDLDKILTWALGVHQPKDHPHG